MPRFGLKRGDAVSVSSKVFDGDKPGSFSKSNPKRQLGTVARVWAGRKLAQVEYADGSKDPLDKEGWPRDFFHAMVSPFASRTPGSSIVPLGEL